MTLQTALKMLRILILLFVSTFIWTQLNAQSIKISNNVEITKWVEQYMTYAAEFDHFNGVVLIARDGKPFYLKGFGFANMELDVPNKVSTKFLIGSVSKQFTAAGIMLLNEKGKLSIDDPVNIYLDSCPATWNSITIKHLLNHTSGLVNFTQLEEARGRFLMVPNSQQEVVMTFRNKQLESQPGEKFNYNNSGYYLLGMIIEKASNQSYAEYIKQNIFMPLGMNNTDFNHQYILVKDRASSYYLNKDRLYRNSPYSDMTNLFSIGGMYSTVTDLLIWQQAIHNHKLLSAKSVSEMLTPTMGGHGYGWVIDSIGNTLRHYHDGGISNFSASLHYLPNEKLTIIAISNAGEDGGIRVAYDIAGKLGNNPATIRAVQREIMEIPAERSFQIIKKYQEGFSKFDAEDKKLMEIGNYLMLSKQKKQAIQVFILTTMLYPKSIEAYFELALAYEIIGEKKLAIENFKKVLSLDPSNDLANEHIERLSK